MKYFPIPCFKHRVLLEQISFPNSSLFTSLCLSLRTWLTWSFPFSVNSNILLRWLKGSSPLSLLWSGLCLFCLNASLKGLYFQCHSLAVYSSCYNFPGIIQKCNILAERSAPSHTRFGSRWWYTNFCTTLPNGILLLSLHTFLAVLIGFSCHWKKSPFLSVFERSKSTLHKFYQTDFF